MSATLTLLMYYVSENIFFSPLSISLFTAVSAAVVTNLVLVPKKFQKFIFLMFFNFFILFFSCAVSMMIDIRLVERHAGTQK